MAAALALAGRGLGRVWPNPAVGCLLVRDGHILGRGWTQPGGRPHAETEAIRRAGGTASGATAYVTLEPCSHTGVTGPCCSALIEAGIRRAVVAVEDPDPRVSGRGIAAMRDAGIDVEVGLLAERARELNRGFFLRLAEARPLVTVKIAQSIDGRIATRSRDSKWITGEDARRTGHLLRARHDGILIGSQTLLDDDPDLTCRLSGMSDFSPVRLVADARLRTRPDCRLVRTARDVPTWIFTAGDADGTRVAALRDAGVVVIPLALQSDRHLPPRAMVEAAAARGMTRLLIEGGGTLVAAFLKAGLVDRLAWFQAPIILGGDGVPAVKGLDIDRVEGAMRFGALDTRLLGDDMLATLLKLP